MVLARPGQPEQSVNDEQAALLRQDMVDHDSFWPNPYASAHVIDWKAGPTSGHQLNIPYIISSQPGSDVNVVRHEIVQALPIRFRNKHLFEKEGRALSSQRLVGRHKQCDGFLVIELLPEVSLLQRTREDTESRVGVEQIPDSGNS